MKKILCVDDDATIRKMVEEILKVSGFQVKVSPSGTDALKKLKKEKFDLVLLDQRMNGRGTDVFKVIKEKYPKTKAMFITAVFDEDAVLQETIKKEGLIYLRKPFGTEELLTAVKKVLREK